MQNVTKLFKQYNFFDNFYFKLIKKFSLTKNSIFISIKHKKCKKNVNLVS